MNPTELNGRRNVVKTNECATQTGDPSADFSHCGPTHFTWGTNAAAAQPSTTVAMHFGQKSLSSDRTDLAHAPHTGTSQPGPSQSSWQAMRQNVHGRGFVCPRPHA